MQLGHEFLYADFVHSFIRSDDFDESCRSICTKETEDSNPITPQLSYSPKHASF